MNKEIAMIIIAQQIHKSNKLELSYENDEILANFEIDCTPKEALEKHNLITKIKIKLGIRDVVILTNFKD